MLLASLQGLSRARLARCEEIVHANVELFREKWEEYPLAWFPRLREATPEQRGHWRLIGQGVGIHWEDIDEDLSVNGLLTSTRPPERVRR